MTSEGFGDMFEGDPADMCAGNFPLMSMGGRADGLACTEPGARTPIGVSGYIFISQSLLYTIPKFTYYPQSIIKLFHPINRNKNVQKIKVIYRTGSAFTY